MKSKSSFTKKEVVVVLGCVVFVLANLGTVGSTGRRRAKEAVCLSNLLKWGVIWESYADDNDGFFPERGGGYDPGQNTMLWWMFITESYYKDRKVLFCPEATRTYLEGGRPPFAAWSTDLDGQTYSSSYSVNLWVSTEAEAKFWRSMCVAEAACVPLLLDGNWKDSEPQPYDEPPPYDGYWWEPNQNEMKRVCINRHHGAVNSVFLDLSVRKIGLKQLWKLKWYRGWPEDYPLPVWPEWMENFKDY